jgi:hypothetical protein
MKVYVVTAVLEDNVEIVGVFSKLETAKETAYKKALNIAGCADNAFNKAALAGLNCYGEDGWYVEFNEQEVAED